WLTRLSSGEGRGVPRLRPGDPIAQGSSGGPRPAGERTGLRGRSGRLSRKRSARGRIAMRAEGAPRGPGDDRRPHRTAAIIRSGGPPAMRHNEAVLGVGPVSPCAGPQRSRAGRPRIRRWPGGRIALLLLAAIGLPWLPALALPTEGPPLYW